MRQHHHNGDEEFVTIVGGDAEEIGRAFQAEGLADKDFTIVHRIGRHRFAMAPGRDVGSLLDGSALVAATYTRRGR
ncbi:hypothetical protein [Ancylobacter pratisalsi]|uniref:Uncharacterized protein n=1 Tax=Ancylobacter pratisalsi TaxID=1745854 RepID=A0A6P1YPW7_9HYPH|nr:hypothetical protein [Ancylobacter pratisalsi]QIB35162.1 hypothetical protein G3A50_16690 [Ancylobacter pratisalsi]